jgi:hypothetical protein
MRAKPAMLILGALTLLPLGLLPADDGDNGISQAVSQPSSSSDCPGRPPNAKPVEYKVLFVKRILSTKRPVPEVLPQPDSTKAINLGGRQQIQDEAEYESVFGSQSSGVDWSLWRIVVVTLSTTYKLDQLDSTVTLS